MKSINILIVDDEPLQIKIMERFVNNMGYNAITMTNGRQVVDFFLDKQPIDGIFPRDVSVMLLDLSMPDINGFAVLKHIANVKGDLQVIVLTASNDVQSVVSAISLGALDYIIKGEKDIFSRTITSINGAIEKKNLKQQLYYLERKNGHQVSFSDLIGSSANFISAINLAKKATNSNIPILIRGEPGTGKELLARAIHGAGSKISKPFVVVNCESLNKSNADLILFGCEKLNENIISEKSSGKIREADGGTLFLGNVNYLSLDTQIKLLRFIQDGMLWCEGGLIKVVTRIISSTTQDLSTAVLNGRFREDLYYRINVFPVYLPSLLERGVEDIRELSENFFREFSINESKKIKDISEEAIELLCRFDWEDNIRQLKNYIFRASALCSEETIYPEHFPQIINYENAIKISRKSLSAQKIGAIDLFDDEGKCKNLERLEVEILRKLLECFDNNLSEVSKQLKVGRSTIYRKLKMYELNEKN